MHVGRAPGSLHGYCMLVVAIAGVANQLIDFDSKCQFEI